MKCPPSIAKCLLVFGVFPFVIGYAPAWGQEATPFKPFLELGIEERVRMEEWNNAFDLNSAAKDSQLQYRFRSRLWGQFNPTPNLEIAAGIAHEGKKIVHPDKAVNARQVFVETLYVDYRFHPDWSVRVGRQNIQRGEGFILMDGGPADGSRSAYYNAVDLTWQLGAGSRLELIAISDPSRDAYLPRLNDPDNAMDVQRLAEWNEQALGLYYTGRASTTTSLEAYYFYKTELHDFRAPSPSEARFQPDRRLHTLGSRAVSEPGDGWTLSGEFALQQGKQEAHPLLADRNTRDIVAWGGYARARKAFGASWKPSVSLGYVAMSGDDPRSSKAEGWDPLFARWPRYSELFLYTLVPEKGPAYWSNMGIWEVEARCAPTSRLDLRATYSRMAALEAQTPGTLPFFGTGKTRGGIWEFRADLKLAEGLKGHAVVERFKPGSFYVGQDAAYFLRFEVSYLYKRRF